jgi:hypothetical protein
MKKWIERLISRKSSIGRNFCLPSRIWTHSILEEAMENGHSLVNACYYHRESVVITERACFSSHYHSYMKNLAGGTKMKEVTVAAICLVFLVLIPGSAFAYWVPDSYGQGIGPGLPGPQGGYLVGLTGLPWLGNILSGGGLDDCLSKIHIPKIDKYKDHLFIFPIKGQNYPYFLPG